MAARKPPVMKRLSEEERLLYHVQDIWAELTQLSPYLLTGTTDMRAKGYNEVFFAEFGWRAGLEMGFQPTDESILQEVRTIGECVAWVNKHHRAKPTLAPHEVEAAVWEE